jgi:uncharacterized protein (TIGR02646 family)
MGGLAHVGPEAGVVGLIPVKPMPEPAGFEEKVRSKGRQVLKQHNPKSPVPGKFWEGKEHWRNCLPELYDSYGGLCSFMAIRIERVTGSRTVDHFKPRSKYPELAYEWSNFRLVCGLLNGRKGAHEDVLDPFELTRNVFGLNPLNGEIFIRQDCPPKLRGKAQTTLARLRLDKDPECTRVRREHVQRILKGAWSAEEARAASPFVYGCLEESGML